MSFCVFSWLKGVSVKKLILIIFLFPYILLADEGDLEKLFTNEEETYKETELHDYLQQLKKDKLDINKATSEQLLTFPWLSKTEVSIIIKLRTRQLITSMQNLIDAGISPEICTEIEPYITFPTNESQTKAMYKPIQIKSRIRFQNKFDSPYDNPLKLYQRHQFYWNDYTLSLLSQKDEGENDYLDFCSASLQKEDFGIIKKAIIGNYRLAIGQGILFAPKIGLSKGGETTRQPVKSFGMLKQYTSTAESFSLFGGASQFQWRKLSILPFYSQYKLDASVINDSINNIDITGFHRTDTEKDKKNAIEERLYGIHLQYGNKKYIGLTAFKYKFDKPFLDKEYPQEQILFGIDYSLLLNRFCLFGEMSITDRSKRRKAYLVGLSLLEKRFENLIIVYDYDKYFPTYHGNPFHNSSNYDNQKGIYYGILFRPAKKSKLNLYFDIYNFPKERYFEKMPTYGVDKFLQFDQKWKDNKIRITVRNQDKETYQNIEDSKKIYSFQRTTLRSDFWHYLQKNVRLRLRAEYSYEDYESISKYDDGFLFFQEIKIVFFKRWQNLIRFTQYRSNDITLYMYENDIDGIMLNSQFSGDGFFWFLLLKYRITNYLSLQFKYAEDLWKTDKLYNNNQIKFLIDMKI